VVTSPWFYLQFGMVLTGAGISFAAGAAMRPRTDLTSLAMGWPAPPRMMLRVLVGYSLTAVFALLMRVTRVVMKQLTWPSRNYLLAIAAKLALAWLVIRLLTSVTRNEFFVRLAARLVAALNAAGCVQARGHPRALPGARNPRPRRRAAGREYRRAGSNPMSCGRDNPGLRRARQRLNCVSNQSSRHPLARQGMICP
jgi:hypothetical protein